MSRRKELNTQNSTSWSHFIDGGTEAQGGLLLAKVMQQTSATAKSRSRDWLPSGALFSLSPLGLYSPGLGPQRSLCIPPSRPPCLCPQLVYWQRFQCVALWVELLALNWIENKRRLSFMGSGRPWEGGKSNAEQAWKVLRGSSAAGGSVGCLGCLWSHRT